MIKGIINPETCQARVYINGKQISLKKSLKIFRSNVNSFMWGYGGAGPTQLSFALLYELTNEKIARSLCESFKYEFIAKLHQFENWQISENKLMKIIQPRKKSFRKRI